MKVISKSISLERVAAELVALTGEQRLVSVIAELKARGLTLATAESCTGGLIGKLLTDNSGASSVYNGGMITYTNRVKINNLGVCAKTIEEHTEVSMQTASEMAQRARESFASDIGISVTGFAGPGGGNEKDPVGTVYIGLATTDEVHVLRVSFEQGSTRAEIRAAAAFVAIGMLEKLVLN